MNLVNNDRMTKIISVVLSVIFGVLVVSLAANAVTTISTNIATGGTLTVDLTSTLTGAVTAEDDLTLSGGDLSVVGATVVDEFTQGGGCFAVTDANGGTIVLTAAQMLTANCLYMTASGGGQETIALTLPATSTMTTLIPNEGDYRVWMINASDLAAATTTTVTKGTGIDLVGVGTAADVLDGAEWGRLSCMRETDTDVTCIIEELEHAD